MLPCQTVCQGTPRLGPHLNTRNAAGLSPCAPCPPLARLAHAACTHPPHHASCRPSPLLNDPRHSLSHLGLPRSLSLRSLLCAMLRLAPTHTDSGQRPLQQREINDRQQQVKDRRLQKTVRVSAAEFHARVQWTRCPPVSLC